MFFANPQGLNNGIQNGYPLRLPYPGEAGQRNPYRGDGFFGIDTGLANSWRITERPNLKFAWEVFNVTNSVRFDTSTASSTGVGLTNVATIARLGAYASSLTVPRVQQFSLRDAF